MGYVGWIDTFEGKKDDPRRKTFESEMVRELRELGAVLYCKTSVPHTLMSGETVNNIIGYTWNPKDRYLCSGGSSGGEGALIGLKGSPVGFGTDIGGSIRIPAAFNGLYGIRPSAGRLPYEGMANSMDGQNSVLSVVGPLAISARSVKFLVKSILSQNPWLYDPLVIEMPWREDHYQNVWDRVNSSLGELTFGVMKTDGIVNPQPPVTRAVQLVAKAVEKAGHKTIDWKPPSHADGLATTFSTWSYDGGKDIHDAFALSGEPISQQIKMTYGTEPKPEKTASEIAKNNIAHRQWKKRWIDAWNSTASATSTGQPIDCIIAPLAPYAAARPEKYKVSLSLTNPWRQTPTHSPSLFWSYRCRFSNISSGTLTLPSLMGSTTHQSWCRSRMPIRTRTDMMRVTSQSMSTTRRRTRTTMLRSTTAPMSQSSSLEGGCRKKRCWRLQNTSAKYWAKRASRESRHSIIFRTSFLVLSVLFTVVFMPGSLIVTPLCLGFIGSRRAATETYPEIDCGELPTEVRNNLHILRGTHTHTTRRR